MPCARTLRNSAQSTISPIGAKHAAIVSTNRLSGCERDWAVGCIEPRGLEAPRQEDADFAGDNACDLAGHSGVASAGQAARPVESVCRDDSVGHEQDDGTISACRAGSRAGRVSGIEGCRICGGGVSMRRSRLSAIAIAMALPAAAAQKEQAISAERSGSRFASAARQRTSASAATT